MSFAYPLAVALETACLVLDAADFVNDGQLLRLLDVAAAVRRGGDRPPPATLRSDVGALRACRARIFDRGAGLLVLVAAAACQAAIWYSCVRPPRTCFRRIWCSARLISGGRQCA